MLWRLSALNELDALSKRLDVERLALTDAEEEIARVETEKSVIQVELQNTVAKHHLDLGKKDILIVGVRLNNAWFLFWIVLVAHFKKSVSLKFETFGYNSRILTFFQVAKLLIAIVIWYQGCAYILNGMLMHFCQLRLQLEDSNKKILKDIEDLKQERDRIRGRVSDLQLGMMSAYFICFI